MEVRKNISVVIPNYNSSYLLKKYLPDTVIALKETGMSYEIIVVDDGSDDDSVEVIKRELPEVTLLTNAESQGFAKVFNQGMEAARYELILFLSPAIKLSPAYFEYQWKYFLAWDTFGVMGRINQMGSDDILEAARVPKFDGFNIKTSFFYYTTKSNDRLLTYYISGVNALIDKEKLKKIGGFCELFSGSHAEDMEVSIRAWRLRWKCCYEHNAVCWREGPSDFIKYKTEDLKKSVYYRNRLYLQAIHLNGFALRAWRLQTIFKDLLPALFTAKKWVGESFSQVKQNRRIIKEHKVRLSQLLEENDSKMTIFNIAAKIRNAVKNKKVVRFRAESE